MRGRVVALNSPCPALGGWVALREHDGQGFTRQVRHFFRLGAEEYRAALDAHVAKVVFDTGASVEVSATEAGLEDL